MVLDVRTLFQQRQEVPPYQVWPHWNEAQDITAFRWVVYEIERTCPAQVLKELIIKWNYNCFLFKCLPFELVASNLILIQQPTISLTVGRPWSAALCETRSGLVMAWIYVVFGLIILRSDIFENWLSVMSWRIRSLCVIICLVNERHRLLLGIILKQTLVSLDFYVEFL